MEKLATEMAYINRQITEGIANVRTLETKLNEPNTGIYARLQNLETNQKAQIADNVQERTEHINIIKENAVRAKQDTENLRLDFKSLETNVDRVVTSVAKLEETNNEDTKKILIKMKEIGGENLNELETIIKFKKNFDKLFWLLLTGIVTTVGKFLFDLFYSHNR